MDVTQALRDAENSLRDFIVLVLSKDGSDWIPRCGVAPERIEKWRERKAAEAKRQEVGVVEERLMYYADFYDLKTILKKNWSGEFSVALGDWKTFEVYIGEIEKLRDADAHRRELLPHQKHLILGVSGEIRNRIVRYRSKMETPDDCFPRIESARDSFGNIWVPSSNTEALKSVATKMSLRPGDVLEFVVTAIDPEDLQLQYALKAMPGATKLVWQSSQSLRLVLEEAHISKAFCVEVSIISPRSYHACTTNDDSVYFLYSVLPRSNS